MGEHKAGKESKQTETIMKPSDWGRFGGITRSDQDGALEVGSLGIDVEGDVLSHIFLILEEWDREGGRETQEGGYMVIYVYV